MHELLLLLTAVLFYVIGRISGRESEALQSTKKTVKKLLHPQKSGVVDFPTPQQLRYMGSEREKIDKEAERVLKEAGL